MRPKWNRKKVLYDRIQRALNESRKAFNDVVYPKLDITSLSVSEAAKTIIKEAGL
jgi:regulator of PEP synthase PpsR (kinase-PPPase family)